MRRRVPRGQGLATNLQRKQEIAHNRNPEKCRNYSSRQRDTSNSLNDPQPLLAIRYSLKSLRYGALNTLKRALQTLKRALYTLIRALQTLKRALHTFKRALQMQHSAIYPTVGTIFNRFRLSSIILASPLYSYFTQQTRSGLTLENSHPHPTI